MEPNRQAGNWDELWGGFRWQVPARYNIARECCGHWAGDRSRFALYYEDEAGTTSAWTFWDIQREANRFSNVLAALGVMRGDRVAILLPQRPETAIAHIACYQMGAIALPLPHLSGPEALEFRLAHAAARVAVVDAPMLEKLAPVRGKLPALRHVIGVACENSPARESWLRAWTKLLPLAATSYTPIDTAADDPALLLYTADAAGRPLGALMAQRTLLGNLPGFVCSHDFYPRPGDMFWSPADWASAGGLFDALLPAWNFGQPVLAYGGRFDPEKAFWLIEKYGVKNAFLVPAALETMVQAAPKPQEKYDLGLRSIVSGGAVALGEAVFDWAGAELGVTINEIFGQTEINHVAGGCSSVYAAKPGSMGRPYPGHRVAILDAAGNPVPTGGIGELCVQRYGDGVADPVFMTEYWNDPQATQDKYFGAGAAAWGRTGELAQQDAEGYLWRPGRAGGGKPSA
ncbi:MAG: hypothetical protein A2045_13870 [Rhodocyclales bacterium GWA2_65_20]|nr:MAG: hypothetical protein A2045_13870 [Rhodocyclales bacterium GWA2_65_20]